MHLLGSVEVMGSIIGPNSIIAKYVKSCTGSKKESEVADFQNSFSPICENTKKPATSDSSPDPLYLLPLCHMRGFNSMSRGNALAQYMRNSLPAHS